VPETIVVAIVKAITVMFGLATSHPIKTGINGTAKGPAGPASHSGAIEAALWAGRPKAATQIAAAETPADVGCTAAGKAAAVTATAKAAVTASATSTSKTVGDSKSCEENCDRSRSHHRIARHCMLLPTRGARLVVFGPDRRRECGQSNRHSKRELGGRGRSRFCRLAVVS
jgi:hypothetical protein